MAKIAKLPALTPIVADDPTSPKVAATPSAPQRSSEASERRDGDAQAEKAVVSPQNGAQSAPKARKNGAVRAAAGTDVDAWSGISTAATHKLPVELLRELDKRITTTGLTKTATISAALLGLLAESDADLIERVDAFQDRFDRARRRARRSF